MSKKPAKSGASTEPASKRADVARDARPHHDEAVATQLARDAFSRERYEFLLRVLFVLLVLLAVSIVANIWLGTRETRFRYFAVDSEGRITEVAPLERPIQSMTEVVNWTTSAITESFTLSFANYQQQLNQYRFHFTDAGWRGFQDALRASRFLDEIIQQQLVTTAVPTAAPVVVAQGIGEGGRFAWRMQIPLLVTFESASGKRSSPFTVDVTVVRRPESENPRGLGIAQIITR